MSNLQVAPSTPTVSVAAPVAAPAPKAQPASAAAPATPGLDKGDQFETYTVKKGDNLWNISDAKLGDPTRWKTIYAMNKDQIKNPDLIYPKQVLKLPIALAQPAQPAPVQPQEPTPPTPAPVQEQPPAPVTPAPPAPVQEQPPTPAPAQPVELPKKSFNLGKAALIGGAIGTVGTAGALTAMTATLGAPLANLGGYGTAQVIASKLVDFGLKVPTGPALSKLISTVGGPKVAAAGVAVGVGLAAAGLAAGGYYLYQKAHK
ncbi:MAG: LysM peptidoglycan-binding domain-containing protein [Candidatus Sericytochromatia bacterium]